MILLVWTICIISVFVITLTFSLYIHYFHQTNKVFQKHCLTKINIQYVLKCQHVIYNYDILVHVLQLTAVSVAEDGFELSLTASFALRGVRDPYQVPPMTGSKVLSDLTQRRRNIDSDSSTDSDERDSIGQLSCQQAYCDNKLMTCE